MIEVNNFEYIFSFTLLNQIFSQKSDEVAYSSIISMHLRIMMNRKSLTKTTDTEIDK